MSQELSLVAATDVFDSDHPVVDAFLQDSGCYRAANVAGAVERLHDAVRDDLDYTVFNVALHPGLSASQAIAEQSGFCLHKSIVFVAGCRRLGVPAVLRSDIVTNHVSDPAMTALVGGGQFLHWFTQIQLNGRWIKAAPIFNTLLCTLYGMEVLRFDPNGDSVEQRNGDDTRLQFLGRTTTYTDPTMPELLRVIRDLHPRMVTGTGRTPTAHSLRAVPAAAR